MRETLYLRLPAAAPAHTAPALGEAFLPIADEAPVDVEFAIASADGTSLTVLRAPLADALQQASGRRIVLLAPASEVRLSSVNVPARQAAKVLQAAPFLLEDQLADDVETLHFAIGPRQADGSHPVAIVALARMEAWLAPLRAAGLSPEALVPEMLALPWDSESRSWSALGEPQQVVVRNGAYAGFACDPEDLPAYLQLADPERTQLLRLFVLSRHEVDASRIDWPLELLPGHADALEAYARHYQPEAAINLLQGAYSQRRNLERYWKPWRTAAIVAGVWLGIAVVAYGFSAWKTSREIQRQEAANLQRFQQIFPAETRVSQLTLAPQLEAQMHTLTSAPSVGQVLPLLDVTAQALAANPGLNLRGLQFQDGVLFLSLKATDLQVVERLRDWFSRQGGAKLDVQSADGGKDGVQLRLKLSLK